MIRKIAFRINLFSFLLGLFVLSHSEVSAQKRSTDPAKSDSTSKKRHSPVAASLLSTVVPGLGQVYNKKYWKVPVVYCGLLTAGYFLKTNKDAYLEYKKAYIAEVDTNPNTFSNIALHEAGLLSYMELYRNRMEISYIAFGLVYVLI